MNRFKNKLYTVERFTHKGGKLSLIQNEDCTLFSGNQKTKIFEEDLPEWYVFGRYYKTWGFLSTKGITDIVYHPNLWINHFLKDDCIMIAYGGKIEINPEIKTLDRYSSYDEMVWGAEILSVLKGAEIYSGYNISGIIDQIRNKISVLKERHPDEFGNGKWDFDIDQWMEKPYKSGRPTSFSRSAKTEFSRMGLE